MEKYEKWETKRGLGKIRRLKRKGWSNNDIASEIGVSRGTFQRWLKTRPLIADAIASGKDTREVKRRRKAKPRATSKGALGIMIPPGDKRTDRLPGNRGAYDKARAQIMKTQTVCGICGKPVDFSYKFPHPLSPTIDHIIPVSKGGHPTDISNLQLAHRCCNREKSDRLVPSIELKEEREKIITNYDLPLHRDWMKYKAK